MSMTEIHPTPSHSDRIRNASHSSSKSYYHPPPEVGITPLSIHLPGDDTISPDQSPTSTTEEELEKWNYPRRNAWCFMGTLVSFLLMGINDASAGPLIPYLEQYYNLSYTVVSLIFLSPCVGSCVAALSNNTIHRQLGQRGLAVIAASTRAIAYMTFCLHPPWPVLVVFYGFVGFANGLTDAGWCAWTGNMVNANMVQGILQAFYSLGATIAPLVATSMITQADLPWYAWYYVMTGIAVVEIIVCTWAFWPKTGRVFRAAHPKTTKGSNTREALNNRVTVICSLFFLVYVGVEVALGGWIVTFMLRERDANPYAAGISATGFWAGQCVGRAILGFITERFGERICVSVYIAFALALQLIFWLVPHFVASAVAVAFLGFFLGPMFPAGVVMCAKILPKHLHVSALGFATAISGVGGAAIPFAVGAIAQARGVWVLQPIILALLAVVAGLWLLLPRVKKARAVEERKPVSEA